MYQCQLCHLSVPHPAAISPQQIERNNWPLQSPELNQQLDSCGHSYCCCCVRCQQAAAAAGALQGIPLLQQQLLHCRSAVEYCSLLPVAVPQQQQLLHEVPG
jgi:hypothetical protein